MQIPEVFISKKNLGKMPRRDRILFIQISMVLTDINVFQKLFIYAGREESKDGIIKRANMQISFNLIFVMCGKLLEAWNLIDLRTSKEKFSKKKKERKEFLSDINWFPREYETQFRPEGNKGLDNLKNYFNNPDNKIRTIRNKISNHYDPDKIEKYLDSSKVEGIAFYAPKRQNWHFFSTANNIFMYGFLEEINPASREDAFKVLAGEILDVSSSFRILAMNYLIVISNKYLVDVETKIFNVPDSELEDKMYINFFS